MSLIHLDCTDKTSIRKQLQFRPQENETKIGEFIPLTSRQVSRRDAPTKTILSFSSTIPLIIVIKMINYLFEDFAKISAQYTTYVK